MTLSKSILLTVTHARKQQKMEVRKQQNSTGCLGGQAAVHTVISTCGRKKLIIQLWTLASGGRYFEMFNFCSENEWL